MPEIGRIFRSGQLRNWAKKACEMKCMRMDRNGDNFLTRFKTAGKETKPKTNNICVEPIPLDGLEAPLSQWRCLPARVHVTTEDAALFRDGCEDTYKKPPAFHLIAQGDRRNEFIGRLVMRMLWHLVQWGGLEEPALENCAAHGSTQVMSGVTFRLVDRDFHGKGAYGEIKSKQAIQRILVVMISSENIKERCRGDVVFIPSRHAPHKTVPDVSEVISGEVSMYLKPHMIGGNYGRKYGSHTGDRGQDTIHDDRITRTILPRKMSFGNMICPSVRLWVDDNQQSVSEQGREYAAGCHIPLQEHRWRAMQTGRVVTSRGQNLDGQGMKRHTKKSRNSEGRIGTFAETKPACTSVEARFKFERDSS
ncbi:hypothetical protein B0H13DRAFT_1870808 [Mycena leptocephala]|nr:hypothetical protein B0H13DRAFT_1870808 [Mycena leptocephala]